MRIPFGIDAYQLRSLPFSAQRMVNCYLETAPPAAKTFAAIVQSYGISPLQTIGDGYARGGLTLNGIPYVVYGTTLYRLTLTTATPLGEVPGGGYVDMAGDETNIMLVTGGLGYYWNGTTVQEITDPDFPGAEWVENIDGYYVIGAPVSGKFYVSTNRNPAEWNALEFASAEAAPDDLVGCIKNQAQLFLFGKESFEVNEISANTDFPLQRSAAGFGDIGLLSRYAAANCDNTVMFPGHDGIVYRLNGYTPVRISHHGIEQAIENMADKTCFGMSWKEGGHAFYGLSFDTQTLVYDVSTQRWHERTSYLLDRWRPLFILRAFDTWITGDFYTNEVGKLDPNSFTEWGHTLVSSATSPPVSEDNKLIAHNRVELVFEQGVGVPIGQGSDPQVMLRWSNDGGRTWSSEHWRSLGRLGEYRRRSLWHRCGSARDRVYEFAVSDPVRRTLILATSDVS